MSTQQPDLLIPESFDPDKVHSAVPQLFIGLGGTGGRIVKRIYERMNSNPNWRKYQESSTGFLVLDTNIDDLDDYEENGKIQKICIKNPDQHERLERAINSRDAHLEQWMPPGYRPRKSNLGAGQIRLESRVAHYINSNSIAGELDRMIGELTSDANAFINKDQNTVRVFMFLTLAGGTGSGCFLPMAFLTRERLEKRGFKPILTGYLLTSKTVKGHQAVKPEIWPQIDANSYAALKELEHFNGLASDVQPFEFPFRKPTASSDPIPLVSEPPFNWVTLIDEPKQNTIGVKGIWKAVADMAYLNIASPSRANEDSARDNYTKFMRRRAMPLASKGTTVSHGFSMYWGTGGAAALVCPRQELLHYCSQRFIAQAIRQQFTLATDSVAESGLDLNKYDATVQRELINNLWLKTFRTLAENEMRTMEDEKAKLMRGGVEAEEAERLAKMGLFYASRWHRVQGTWPGTGASAPAKKKKTSFFGDAGDDAEGKTALEASALIEHIEETLDKRISKIDTNLASAGALNVAAAQLASQTLMGSLDDGQTKARSKWATMQTSIEFLERSVRELFDDLRKTQVGEQEFELDAITERYLVLELLEKYAAKWIQAAEAQRDACAGDTLLTENDPEWRKRASKLSKDVDERKVDTVREWLGEKFTSADYEDDLSNFVVKANKSINELVRRTNDWARAEIAFRQMTAFINFLKSRAKTYAELSQYAMERSDALDQTAAKLMEEDLEDDKSYELSVEVLRDVQTGTRRWDWFWEDEARPVVNRLLADPKLLGSTISQAMKDEEERINREGLSTADPKQVLKACEDAFGSIAQAQMSQFVRENTTIDNLIEIEAVYGMLDPTDTRSRAEVLTEARAALVSPDHPQHETVEDRLNKYVTGKLRQLKSKAEPLANFTKGAIDIEKDPMADLTIMVATERVLNRMEKSFGRALKTINEKYQETGLQEWSDPRTLVLYHGIATTPIYAYDDVEGALHGSYTTIQNMPHKANPLHIANQWEAADALPDLTIASRAKGELERWRDTNRAFLVDLMRVGLLRAETTDDTVEWQIKTEEWNWPDPSEQPVRFHDERSADALFSRLASALSGPIRTNLEADIKTMDTKTRIGGQAAKAIEKLVRVARAKNWRDAGLIEDLDALGTELRATLD